MRLHVAVSTVFLPRLKRVGLPLHKRVAVLLRAEVRFEVLGPGAIGHLGPQVHVEVALALGLPGAEQMRQVAAGQVHVARGGVVEDLRLVVLRVQGGAEVDRCRHVAVEKAVVAGVKVFVPWQAGALSAAGAVAS